MELALQVDLKLAKDIANMPEETELQRQLWLNISKYTTPTKYNTALLIT